MTPRASYARPLARARRARRIEAAVVTAAQVAMMLMMALAVVQMGRLAVGTSALDAVLAQAAAMRGM